MDAGLDAAMDRLHEVVSGKLGHDGSLVRLANEAEAGQQALSDRTRQWVTLAVEDAVEQDPEFAKALREAVAKIQAAGGSVGGANVMSGNTFMGPTAVQTGDHSRQENHFGPKA
ncbi:hypothetical protein [Kitasatospora sp. NPDC001175]|uniref:hypothetical protein n=1 Tax=Kitasatospora sp. NPDC001175 TaxID=3157103 RepID=UPI003D03A384